MEFRCVIFDAGQVLVNFRNDRLLQALAEKSEAEPTRGTPAYLDYLLFEAPEALVKPFERGEWTSTQFFQIVRAAINAPSLTEDEFFRIWNDIFLPNLGIDTVLDRIQKGVRKMILSNTNPLHWGEVKRGQEALLKHFPDDAQILSYREKARKPEEKIFRAALERADVAPGRIVYVDDRQENLDTFVEFGVHGIRYDCRTDNARVLASQLEELNVIATF